MKEEPLQLDTRKKIYDLIETTPGIHFREISRRLDIPMGVVEYHINYMLKRDMIVARMEGRYKRYYTEGKIGSKEKSVLAFLRKDVPRAILMHLMLNPGARHRDLKSELGLSGSTLTFHLKKMIKKGLVIEEGDEGGKGYHVSDPETVSRTLIIYKRSFMDDLVDSFTETWMDMEF
ncbi:MAG: winged helix-turn-helix transcriptional regulator [Candidatus Thermoplasmatota archaeon]|nr:winged helix-turn-helix transcriptional regulator [Candidatus Thermoplasmatota archaeon]